MLLAEGDWMTRKSSIIKFISFLLLTCSTSLIGLEKPIGVSSAILQAATVSVSPSSVTVPVDQNFTINVTVSGVSDLYGWEFQLGWNSTFLDAVDVSEGPFLKTGGPTFFTYTVNATGGYMIVDCTLWGNIPGVSGDGTLATITFYAKSVGECPLDLRDVALLNSLEQSITCQAVSGYAYITPPHDVAVTDVTASPVTVLPGDIVNINVTVQNQGGFAETFDVTVYANSQFIGVQTVSLGNGSSTNIIFAWNTTGFAKGDYTVLASASVVPGEVNTANNSKAADNIVTILYPGHDVAVTRLEPLEGAVGRGYNTNITVTVKNYGIFSETFNTTAYAGTTDIKTQTVTLASANSIRLIVTWNTTGFAKGNYTLSAYAQPVPNETDTADNNYTGGWIFVSTVGDFGGPVNYSPTYFACDGKVDGYDLALFIEAYRGLARPEAMQPCDLGGPVDYTPTFYACDGKVDGYDLALFIKCYRGLGPDP
jgi:hypothetical protein